MVETWVQVYPDQVEPGVVGEPMLSRDIGWAAMRKANDAYNASDRVTLHERETDYLVQRWKRWVDA